MNPCDPGSGPDIEHRWSGYQGEICSSRRTSLGQNGFWL
jgi:hypothetical protein